MSPKIIVVRSKSEQPETQKVERQTVPVSLREMRRLQESRNLLAGPESLKDWELPTGNAKWNIYHPDESSAVKYKMQRQQSKVDLANK